MHEAIAVAEEGRYVEAMKRAASELGIGNRLAPARFIAAAAVGVVSTTIAIMKLDWRTGTMLGFDLAAATFLLSLINLFRCGSADTMRRAARRNDANRVMLLVITGIVMMVILVAVAAELSQKNNSDPWRVALIIATLFLAWTFSNLVYALHYAHLFYSRNRHGQDSGGIAIPGAKEPDYWDFTYFAFTLGMTFQTSDSEICDGRIRRIATFHCLAAFVFNIGVLAFTINVLGGS